MKVLSIINFYEIINFIIVFAIGCIVAYAELLSRYQAPSQILKVGASIIYLLLNGITSILAYIFILEFNILKDSVILRVIVAGTSALVILRSSLATIKIGDKNVEAGLASILQVFLNSADRAFDQKRSNKELSAINRVMQKIDFDKAKLAIPTTCFTIMKNVSQEEQDLISAEVEELSNSDLDNKTKSINLGIILANVTGLDLLEKSINVLGDSITEGDSESHLDQINKLLDNLGKKLK